MCSASLQPNDLCRAWFAPVVAGPAKRHEITGGVGRGNAPRQDVVNVQASAFTGQDRLQLAAALTRAPVAVTNSLSDGRPVCTPAIMARRAPLPSGAVRPAFTAFARSDVAAMTAKPARLAIKRFKGVPAMVTSLTGRLNAAPSCLVIASHVAKLPRFGVVSECLKVFAAACARFYDAGSRLALSTFDASVPRRPSVRPRATLPAILSVAVAGEGFPALGACVVNGPGHNGTITRTRFEINHFAIACGRVTPTPKPVQESLL
jgi:hypothetical protein